MSNTENFMTKSLGSVLRISICAVVSLQLMGCGTILHPERKGQKGGRLDAGIVLLDGVGLLLFLIPGIIAFAVDFNNGTIYLPGGLSSSGEAQDIKIVKFDPKHGNLANIERIVSEETSRVVQLNRADIQVTKLKSESDMLVQFSNVLPEVSDNRLALIR
jgi:hypothetical protein